jgi:hypothetical protein
LTTMLGDCLLESVFWIVENSIAFSQVVRANNDTIAFAEMAFC